MISDIEIHITTSNLLKGQISEFESFCESINAKPIIIELSEGIYYRQPMISKTIKCSTKFELEEEISILESSFIDRGFPVVRTKIEVAPWHIENVEKYFSDKSKTYFEWHGKVYIGNEPLLVEICEKHKAKLSRNSLKDDLSRKFITIRDQGDQQSIVNRIKELKQSLASEGIIIVNEELEYCIYDSNKLLDKGWIN